MVRRCDAVLYKAAKLIELTTNIQELLVGLHRRRIQTSSNSLSSFMIRGHFEILNADQQNTSLDPADVSHRAVLGSLTHTLSSEQMFHAPLPGLSSLSASCIALK